MSLALLQFNPSSVVLMDNEGRIQSLNTNAERLLSTTEANAVGKVYTEVFGDSLASRVFSLVLKGSKADVRTIEATLPGGRRARLRASAGPARDVGADLGYGVGVHTGEAMVGNLGSDQYQNFTAIGDTVNVAARLQAQAKPGEVICSKAVVAAAGKGVRTTPLGELEL